jgi:hypothetical protein
MSSNHRVLKVRSTPIGVQVEKGTLWVETGAQVLVWQIEGVSFC